MCIVQDGRNLCFPACFFLMRTMHLNCVLHQEMRANPPTHFIAVFLIGRLSLHPCFSGTGHCHCNWPKHKLLKSFRRSTMWDRGAGIELGSGRRIELSEWEWCSMLVQGFKYTQAWSIQPIKTWGVSVLQFVLQFYKKITLQLHSCNESKIWCVDTVCSKHQHKGGKIGYNKGC